MDPAAQKRELRAALRRARAALPAAERESMSASIAAQVARLPAFAVCRCLLTYVSVREEVDTRTLIAQALAAGKRVAAPHCEGERMAFYEFESLDVLVPGRHGLPEPPARVPAAWGEDALCLVPGFSFDRSGGRVGYGGGYYDRFLPTFTGVTVGLCYGPLLSQTPLPVEAHDVPVQLVATENGVFAAGRAR